MSQVKPYQTLAEADIPINSTAVWKLRIDLERATGKFELTLREYKNSGGYIGYTRKGITHKFSNAKELETFQSTMNTFLEEAKGIVVMKESVAI